MKEISDTVDKGLEEFFAIVNGFIDSPKLFKYTKIPNDRRKHMERIKEIENNMIMW